MTNKVTVITALTFLITHVGFTPSALAHQAQVLEGECEGVLGIKDRSILQQQLELLLDQNPSHECIPLIVGLLGGAPLASAFDDVRLPASDNDDTFAKDDSVVAEADTTTAPY